MVMFKFQPDLEELRKETGACYRIRWIHLQDRIVCRFIRQLTAAAQPWMDFSTAQRIEAGLRYDPSYGADAARDLTALLKTVQAGSML